ncbi:MAG: hypothetical protein AAB583_00790 [Patescibacteria group bacterium]
MAEGDMVEQGSQELSRRVDAKEREAHEFRFTKLSHFPSARAALAVIRNNEDIWDSVNPTASQQVTLEQNTALKGESHRIGAALFANVYRNAQAAALMDVAIFDATQDEAQFFKDLIARGTNYSPVSIVGGGGVYGTIFSAASLKENPESPPLGFDANKRRGGIWGTSGDVTLDKSWWRMNSRNRPENRDEIPVPGGKGNLNSLGSDTQNLQVPDISSAQYPTNNELGRVLAHDNFLSNNLLANAELVKARVNRNKRQIGQIEQEFHDPQTGKRFFVYTDKVVQATGLGKEDLGFSTQFSSTAKALEENERIRKEGLKTPLVSTFFQLVEETTSNRANVARDFKAFGLLGKGDTSRVIREFFIGIGGIDPGLSAQEGFVEGVTVFGLPDKTREELARSERARYILGLLEFERTNGGFFRIKPVDGRVVGIGIPKDKEGLIVYYRRTDQTPEGPVTTIASEIVPRLVTASGFEDMSDKIYSGLTTEEIVDKKVIQQRIETIFAKEGNTVFYSKDGSSRLGGVNRMDIDMVFGNGRFADVTIVDLDGNTIKKRLDRQNLGEDAELLDPALVSKLEIAGLPPKFSPLIDKDFDDEIPVAEKAEGFEIYKVGACTNYPLTDKEKRQTPAFSNIPENTKSIFRFVRPVAAFAKKIARQTPRTEGALNVQRYTEKPQELSYNEADEKRDVVEVKIDEKNLVQKLSANLKTDNLVKYLALSRLNCLFPQNLSGLSFGIKRIQNKEGLSSLAIQCDPPIPKKTKDGRNKEWDVIDEFFSDALVQRALLRLARKSSSSLELKIGLKRRMVDIRNVTAISIKGNEENGFYQKYPLLREKGT